MDVIPAIKERVSVESFLQEPIQRDSIERIMEAGRRAPSAKNRQTWRFIVIRDAGIKEKIADAAYGQECFHEAPVVIAACTTNVDYRMPNGQLSYPIDIGIAVSFMLIQAEAEGLGTCINSTYDETLVREILTVPYSMRIVLLLCIGKPAHKPLANQRKPLNAIVSYDHW